MPSSLMWSVATLAAMAVIPATHEARAVSDVTTVAPSSAPSFPQAFGCRSESRCLWKSSSRGPSAETYTNPVIDADFPDPELVVAPDGTYWAYATGDPATSSIQVTSSTDLVTWAAVADALPERPSWQPLQVGLTWAPDVVFDGHEWRMYYVARDSASGHQCLSIATASTPAGPFEDRSSEPFLCQHELGGSIDPHVFVDGDGSSYLFWKNDGNAIGVDTRIWVQPLAPDGRGVIGVAIDTGLRQRHPWQGDIVEAPSVVRIDDEYVMFYSANGYWSADYAIGYATATSVTGPYADRSPVAWVSSRGDAAGPGGQTTIELGGELWMAYHAWDPAAVGYENGGQRSMWLDRIVERDGTIELDGPTEGPQPVPTPETDH